MTICVAYIYNVITVPPLRFTQTDENKSTYYTQIYGPTAGLMFIITYIQMIRLTRRKTSTQTHTHTPVPCGFSLSSWYCEILLTVVCSFFSLKCEIVDSKLYLNESDSMKPVKCLSFNHNNIICPMEKKLIQNVRDSSKYKYNLHISFTCTFGHSVTCMHLIIQEFNKYI